MGKPYSMDLRERAVAAVLKEGLSRHESPARFGVVPSTVINWVRRFRETGSLAPGQMGGRKPKGIAGEHAVFMARRVRDGAFTLRGLVAELAERGLKVDYRSVWNFVHAEKLSFKKNVVASERDRPDVARRRAQWTKRQSGIDPKRLVFIDETWTKTNMEPLRGWAPKGERLVAKVPHGHWQTMTFVASLRHDRIEAPWLIDGPIDGQGFRTYVEKALAPTLKPGDVVIMDNLGSHKGEAVRQAIRSAGAKLFFLPKYSPDLQSSKSSPSSSIYCAKRRREPSIPSSPPSANCSAPTPPKRAPTTSKTPDMDKPENIAL
jgi:transposase